MMHNMITDYHNYDNGYIGLVNINLDNLPDTVTVKGYTLHKKTELHISLICAKKVAPLIDENNKDKIESELVEKFKKFVDAESLSEFKFLPEFRFVERDERKTVVVMVSVPHLSEFFDELRSEYDVDLPIQPTHVTLYTLQPETGIGILSDEELEEYSTSVDVPELNELAFTDTL